MPAKQKRKRVKDEAEQVRTEFQWGLSEVDPEAKLHVERIHNEFALMVNIAWGDGSKTNERLHASTWFDQRDQYSQWINEILNGWKLTSS